MELTMSDTTNPTINTSVAAMKRWRERASRLGDALLPAMNDTTSNAAVSV